MHTFLKYLCSVCTIFAVLDLNFVSETTKRFDLQIKIPHFKKSKVKSQKSSHIYTHTKTQRRQDINLKK